MNNFLIFNGMKLYQEVQLYIRSFWFHSNRKYEKKIIFTSQNRLPSLHPLIVAILIVYNQPTMFMFALCSQSWMPRHSPFLSNVVWLSTLANALVTKEYTKIPLLFLLQIQSYTLLLVLFLFFSWTFFVMVFLYMQH